MSEDRIQINKMLHALEDRADKHKDRLDALEEQGNAHKEAAHTLLYLLTQRTEALNREIGRKAAEQSQLNMQLLRMVKENGRSILLIMDALGASSTQPPPMRPGVKEAMYSLQDSGTTLSF